MMERKKDNVSIPLTRSITEMLRSDPTYMAKNAEREKRFDKHREEFLRQSAPMLGELRNIGLNYSSTEDLRHSGIHYDVAIPILIKWLPLIADYRVKESIVRALSVPWAKPVAARPLIDELKRTTGLASDSLKFAIGNALSIVADDGVFDELVGLVKDRKNDSARQMIAVAIGTMKDPRAVDVLVGLLNDDLVVGHALVGLVKLKAPKVRSYIEPLLDHSNIWVRKEAKKALAKLAK